jgi:hypothetical protein
MGAAFELSSLPYQDWRDYGKYVVSPVDRVGGRNGKVIPDRVVGKKALSTKAKSYLKRSLELYPIALKERSLLGQKRLSYAWTLMLAGELQLSADQFEIMLKSKLPKISLLSLKKTRLRPVEVEALGYYREVLKKLGEKSKVKKVESLLGNHELRRFAISPIALSMDPNFDRSEWVIDLRVTFDLDGHGILPWRWIHPKVGWLVYHPGKLAMSGSFLFGNVTFGSRWANGYEALCSLDDNQDGKITNAEFDRLGVWFDKNQNASMEEHEFFSLVELGIVELSCTNSLASWGEQWNPSGVKLMDGTYLKSIDLLLSE